MHKSEEYGTILLKQKDKQALKPVLNFAYKIAKHLLFTQDEIEKALIELLDEKVLQIEGDILSQKRMIKDNSISLLRSKAGKKGGQTTQKKDSFASDFALAKVQANTEDAIAVENEIDNEINKEDITKIEKLFISTWQRRPKNLSEILAVEKMFVEYSEKHIIQAFRRAAEQDVITVAYVKGILKKHYEKMASDKVVKEAKKKKLDMLGVKI